MMMNCVVDMMKLVLTQLKKCELHRQIKKKYEFLEMIGVDNKQPIFLATLQTIPVPEEWQRQEQVWEWGSVLAVLLAQWLNKCLPR